MRQFLLYFFHPFVTVLLGMVCCSCGSAAEDDLIPADNRYLRLSLSPATELDAGATQIALKVETNLDYSVVVDAEWLKLQETTLPKDGSLHFSVEANPTSDSRTATIAVADRNDRYYSQSVKVVQRGNPNPVEELSIVDKQATAQTKALLANLWSIADKGFIFGHHDDLWYGRYWYNEPGGSDTKAVCGDYPGVFSVDFATIMDDRYNSAENAIRRRVILEARERGEVIMACAHLNNPLTGGDSWDNSHNDVVRSILTPGSATREKFITWLDRLADFALNLKDSKGELIPVIFRPLHEHTQGWSWWGSSCTTESEFVEFWQMIVTYLRDTKGVHNLLYAVSPQLDSWYDDQTIRDRLLYRWPGDNFVDFIGMDCYHGENPDAFSNYLRIATEISLQKRKPCGVTEDGVESFTRADYWTYSVLEPALDKRISMVVMWRNKYVGTNEADKHYFSVYPGHPSEENFRTMYSSERTFFSKDLPDMYTLPDNIRIK